MSQSGVIFISLIAAVLGKPGILSSPLIATLTPGAPVGPDGRVLDTPEVAIAKAEHAAAQVNERINLANEAVRSGGALQTVVGPGSLIGPVVSTRALLVPGATVGPDGRVLDTPEVAVAKAAHAAAQINERINLANEAARSGGGLVTVAGSVLPVPVLGSGVVASLVPGAPIGPDGRVQDTPEVAVARAAHIAAHVNEKINLANEAVKASGVIGLSAPAALAFGGLVH